MNSIDQFCLDSFPELEKYFSKEKLEDADALGPYIFHEDFFFKFITQSDLSSSFLTRVANYVEQLASSPLRHIRDLAEVAMIENFVDNQFLEIAPYLKSQSKVLLTQVRDRMYVDVVKWMI